MAETERLGVEEEFHIVDHELLTTANRVAFVQAARQWVVDHL